MSLIQFFTFKALFIPICLLTMQRYNDFRQLVSILHRFLQFFCFILIHINILCSHTIIPYVRFFILQLYPNTLSISLLNMDKDNKTQKRTKQRKSNRQKRRSHSGHRYIP